MDEGKYVKNGKALRVNYDNLHAYHIAFGQEIYNELTNKIDKLEKQLRAMKECTIPESSLRRAIGMVFSVLILFINLSFT